MARHDDTLSMRHMLDHAREAVALVKGKTRDDLKNNRLLQLGLTRLVEIIGEAATRVSQKGQARHSTIPWRVAIGMRHRLIHGYDVVDLDVLYDTVTDDLPGLIQELERILQTLGSD
jgi:uncharacterized protein with HEPN domain